MIYSDQTLTFFPFSDRIVTINNIGRVTNDYNIDSSFAPTLIRDSLYNYFGHKSNSTVTNVKLSNVELPLEISEGDTSTANYFPLTKNLDVDESCSFMLSKEEYLKSFDIEPDIILVINKIETGQDLMVTSYVNPVTGIPSSPSILPYIGINVEFMIWDYKNHEPIKYGDILVKTGESYDGESNIWNSCFRNVIKEIVYRTPFELKSGVRIKQN